MTIVTGPILPRAAAPAIDLGSFGVRFLLSGRDTGGAFGLVEHPVPLLEAKAAWTEEVIGRVEALAARGWPDARIRDAVLGREPVTGLASRGEYSKLNLVRVVRAGR